MGGGIAMACANAGPDVVISDTGQEQLDAGLARIRSNYDTSMKRGRFTPEAVQERLGRIRTEVGPGGVGTADLIIEAVFENMALKKEIFQTLDAAAKPDAILATNTSTLDIDQIAAVTRRPEKVVGLHFFSPANVMRLLRSSAARPRRRRPSRRRWRSPSASAKSASSPATRPGSSATG